MQHQDVEVVPEQAKRNPAEEQGSLSAFLVAATQGQSFSKKKIVMPPPGAY